MVLDNVNIENKAFLRFEVSLCAYLCVRVSKDEVNKGHLTSLRSSLAVEPGILKRKVLNLPFFLK